MTRKTITKAGQPKAESALPVGEQCCQTSRVLEKKESNDVKSKSLDFELQKPSQPIFRKELCPMFLPSLDLERDGGQSK